MFEKVKSNVCAEWRKFNVRRNIRRYERLINKGWKMVLDMNEDSKYTYGEILMRHEEKLNAYKKLYAALS